MISHPLFLISILISAWIAFITVAVIVENSLILFKIKQGRVRSILRGLPFLSLFLDLLLNSFSIGHWLNPLNCSSCVQKLLLTFFFPELKHHLYSNEISLLTYLEVGISPTPFSVAFVLFLAVTMYFTSRFLFEAFMFAKALRSMMTYAERCHRPISNVSLAAAIKKNKVKIFSSEKVKIPMATYPNAIFMPNKIIKEFPQDEFEAIIAHELEHLLWSDQTTRLFSQLISEIFWWIPIQAWQKKLEFDQEIACDQSILKYGFHEEFLASALIKAVKATKEQPNQAFCCLSHSRNPSIIRLQIMLGIASTYSKGSTWLSYAVAATASLVGIICALRL